MYQVGVHCASLCIEVPSTAFMRACLAAAGQAFLLRRQRVALRRSSSFASTAAAPASAFAAAPVRCDGRAGEAGARAGSTDWYGLPPLCAAVSAGSAVGGADDRKSTRLHSTPHVAP